MWLSSKGGRIFFVRGARSCREKESSSGNEKNGVRTFIRLAAGPELQNWYRGLFLSFPSSPSLFTQLWGTRGTGSSENGTCLFSVLSLYPSIRRVYLLFLKQRRLLHAIRFFWHEASRARACTFLLSGPATPSWKWLSWPCNCLVRIL